MLPDSRRSKPFRALKYYSLKIWNCFQMVVALQCPELPALRDKYMYNITPWTSTVSSGLRRGLRLFYTEDDSGDSGDNSEDDDDRIAVAAAFGIADLFRSPRRRGRIVGGDSPLVSAWRVPRGRR